jgi:ADP-ribose pyrophosphatase YjhB (NUDIX family)
MKSAVRAIITHNDKLLVMKRNKFGSEYYTLIGGHVELGESLEKALLREIHEETMLTVANPRQVYIESAHAPYGLQHIYVCDYISGEPQLHPHADEVHINKLGQNIYTPMWLPLSKLPGVTFRSGTLQKKLIHDLSHGFAATVQKLQS